MFDPRRLMVVGVLLGVLAVVVSPASAKQPECRVENLGSPKLGYNSNTHTNPLGSAIAEAQPGATLQVIGTCHGNFAVTNDLTLRGRSSEQHEDVIDGGGSGVVLRNTSAAGAFDLAVSDLTITGGDIGVMTDGASLSLMRTKVAGNDRGVINGFIADTTIADSVVSDNDGLGVTGGFFGSITIDNSTVSRNAGGGVYSGRASLTISGSLIAGNDGGGVGGSRHIEVSDSAIEGNTREGVGGGIAAFDLGTLELTDSIVRGNSASRGGGIFLDRSLLSTITGSVVTGNSAAEAGGGIYGPGDGLLSIANSTVSNNSASSGGGLYLFAHGGNRTEIASSTVTGNTAVYGAGIWNDQPLTLTDSAVTGNTAITAGGGIFNTGAVTLVGTATVCGNTPDDWPGCSA